MKTGLVQDTTKSAKSLAQQIAKQMAREPLEVLKTARAQVGNEQAAPSENFPQNQESDDQKIKTHREGELADKMKSGRRMEALNRELSDIQKKDLFSDLQRRISQGEEIPLDDFPGLSIEEKQVLKAQMEAVRIQKANIQNQSAGVLVEPASRKGRQLFNFGKKAEVKRQQTHVEKIVPPSG